MTKYVANALLATKISFINEMANLCERLRRRHQRRPPRHRPRQRIGFAVPLPRRRLRRQLLPQGRPRREPHGQATWATTSQHAGRRSIAVNERQKDVPSGKTAEALRRQARRARRSPSGAWRSSRETDDIREAPALVLAAPLQGEGAHVRVYDPEAAVGASEMLGSAVICESAEEALDGADAAVLVTEWPEFAELDWAGAVSPTRCTARSSTRARSRRGSSTSPTAWSPRSCRSTGRRSTSRRSARPRSPPATRW